MSNETNYEVVEVVEEVNEEKVGIGTKIKEFCRNNKKKLAIGGAIGAAILGVGIALLKSRNGEDCDVCSDDDDLEIIDLDEETIE